MKTFNLKDYISDENKLYELVYNRNNFSHLYLDEETKNNKALALGLFNIDKKTISLFNPQLFDLEDYKNMDCHYYPLFPKEVLNNKEFILGFIRKMKNNATYIAAKDIILQLDEPLRGDPDIIIPLLSFERKMGATIEALDYLGDNKPLLYAILKEYQKYTDNLNPSYLSKIKDDKNFWELNRNPDLINKIPKHLLKEKDLVIQTLKLNHSRYGGNYMDFLKKLKHFQNDEEVFNAICQISEALYISNIPDSILNNPDNLAKLEKRFTIITNERSPCFKDKKIAKILIKDNSGIEFIISEFINDEPFLLELMENDANIFNCLPIELKEKEIFVLPYLKNQSSSYHILKIPKENFKNRNIALAALEKYDDLSNRDIQQIIKPQDFSNDKEVILKIIERGCKVNLKILSNQLKEDQDIAVLMIENGVDIKKLTPTLQQNPIIKETYCQVNYIYNEAPYQLRENWIFLSNCIDKDENKWSQDAISYFNTLNIPSKIYSSNSFIEEIYRKLKINLILDYQPLINGEHCHVRNYLNTDGHLYNKGIVANLVKGTNINVDQFKNLIDFQLFEDDYFYLKELFITNTYNFMSLGGMTEMFAIQLLEDDEILYSFKDTNILQNDNYIQKLIEKKKDWIFIEAIRDKLFKHLPSIFSNEDLLFILKKSNEEEIFKIEHFTPNSSIIKFYACDIENKTSPYSRNFVENFHQRKNEWLARLEEEQLKNIMNSNSNHLKMI